MEISQQMPNYHFSIKCGSRSLIIFSKSRNNLNESSFEVQVAAKLGNRRNSGVERFAYGALAKDEAPRILHFCVCTRNQEHTAAEA
jgi:hypothetical protein